jgi:predicted RNA-binding protein associated with RNAse of E/G family
VSWSPGETVVRREVLNDGRCWLETDVTVVHDDTELLVTYLAGGTPLRYPLGFHPWHPKAAWEGHGVLMLHRPDDWYSVWAFWRGEAREFAGWYLNFQEPFRRGEQSYETQDLELDIWIPRDGPWQWKDRHLIEERVREGRFTAEQARTIRAEGDRVAADLDAGRQWWDPGWAGWSPD